MNEITLLPRCQKKQIILLLLSHLIAENVLSFSFSSSIANPPTQHHPTTDQDNYSPHVLWKTRPKIRLSTSVTVDNTGIRSTVPTSRKPSPKIGGGPMPWTQNTKIFGEFDQESSWAKALESVTEEAISTYKCIDVEGTVPTDLKGTFYRAGPGNFERKGKRYEHVLDGDGFVAAFRFETEQRRRGSGGGGGSSSSSSTRVQYTGRFVETEYWKAEVAQDKILYRNVFGTQPAGGMFTNAGKVNLKNVANTNVVHWGGRLFALWEAGRPYELDPVTLDTLPLPQDDDEDEKTQANGPFEGLGPAECMMRGMTVDQGGPIDQVMKLGKAFTAHPHVVLDPRTKEPRLLGFQSAQNPINKSYYIYFVEYDTQWNVVNKVSYESPKTNAAPHDFMVSQDYYAYIENAVGLNTLEFIAGIKSPTQVMRLSLEKPAILHLVPRNDKNEKPLRVELPAYFNIHTLPQMEQKEGKLTLYSNGWDLTDERFFPNPKESVPFLGSWGGRYPAFDGTVPPAGLYRTVVNLRTGQLESHEEVVPGLVMEFPTQELEQPKNAYMSVASTDGSCLPGTGVAKVNLQTGDVEYWWAPYLHFTGECFPVRKRNGQPGYWVLTFLYDTGSKKRTRLAIFDGENFTNGPVARINLPHYLTYGLHNYFSPSE